MLKRLGQPGIQTYWILERVEKKLTETVVLDPKIWWPEGLDCCHFTQVLPELSSVSEWINPNTDSPEGGLIGALDTCASDTVTVAVDSCLFAAELFSALSKSLF